MPFTFHPTSIPEVVAIEPRVFTDRRGPFAELYKASDFRGISGPLVQVNASGGHRGVLRGLHYQLAPRAQGKLIYATAGEIFDVAVDVREGSPTFGRWVGHRLAAYRRTMLWIPPGFAHGLLVTSERAEVVYHCTAEYAPDYERGVRWDDPEIGIDWPLAAPVLSERDAALPPLAEAERNFRYGEAGP